jgi:cell fate regulator YaaT (PSP1 superfamily)
MACGSGGCGGRCSSRTDVKTGKRVGGCGSPADRCGSPGGSCPSTHAYDWLIDVGVRGALAYDIVEVTFKAGRKRYLRNIAQLDLHTGDHVIVEADRGVDFGTVSMTGELVRLRVTAMDPGMDGAIKGVIRIASLDDTEEWEKIRYEDAQTFVSGREIIESLKLLMKLVDVEWQFDRKKVTFYYTADHRVDFRELVRKLASRFRTRVEMRQIGTRDEAARTGGIGSCGRELCCSTWLRTFKPVSTSAAKTQNLPLNPVRLSGQCGRLKCCLNYELEQYMQALAVFPAADLAVRTDLGLGYIRKIDIFKDIIWIQHAGGEWEDLPLETVNAFLDRDDSRK